MPICLIQTNLPSVPADFHVALSKVVAETLSKPEEVLIYYRDIHNVFRKSFPFLS